MSKQKRSKIRAHQADRPGRKRGSLVKASLWLGGLLLAISGIFIAGRWGGSNQSADSFDAAGKYVRREAKPTLSPALFIGRTASAYRIAQEIPDIVDRLYCYCHCDKSIGHLTLLSCFTDNHAANCAVCQNEAIEALAMLKQGLSVDQIRRQIDLKYARA